jgi:aminoglycoside 6'-N-acetyltransferase I
MIKVRSAVPTDARELTRMRIDLWPDHAPEWHAEEVEKFFRGELPMPIATLVAEDESGRTVGFAELSIRPYAEGCDTSRVAFLEGWYVEESARRGGVGRALVEGAEQWAIRQGCTEFGSNALIDNDVSAAAHRSLGFEEVECVRYFRKDLAGRDAQTRG